MNIYKFKKCIQNRSQFEDYIVTVPNNLNDCTDSELTSYLRVLDPLYKIRLLKKYQFYEQSSQTPISDPLLFINKELTYFTPICRQLEQQEWTIYTHEHKKYELNEDERIFENTVCISHQDNAKLIQFLTHLTYRLNCQLTDYTTYYKIIPNEKDYICWIILMVQKKLIYMI
jgi:hypothetical protein